MGPHDLWAWELKQCVPWDFIILVLMFEWIPTRSCRQDIGGAGNCRLWAEEFSGQDFHLFDKTLSFEKPMFTGWSI